MKKLIAILAMVLFAGTAYAAPFLVCDPVDSAEYFIVEVDGVVVADNQPAETDRTIHYDMAPFTGGDHTVRAKAGNMWGVSDWSLPFDFNADLPGSPSGFGFSAE